MRISLILLVTCIGLAGCAQSPSYQLSHSLNQIKQLQLLDPNAPENNDGITRELQGDYAKKAAENYRNSIYTGKEGRDVQDQTQAGGSGSR